MKLPFRLLLLFAVLFGNSLTAQNTFYANYDPSPGNQVYFGGFKEIIPTPDNGYAVLSGTYEKVVAKLNANMEVEWAFRFAAPGLQTTFGVYDMTISNDGKIVVLGYGGAGNDYAFLTKMNLDGSVVWNKKIGSDYASCGFHLIGKQILNAYDNGFLMLGSTSDGNSMVLRLDTDGQEVWSKVYDNANETNTSRINNGVQSGNNTYMLQASMRSYSFLKIDDSGNLLSHTHHDDSRNATYPEIITEGPNGNYFSVAQTRDVTNNDRRQLLTKIDANGALTWSKEISVDSTLDMYQPYSLFFLPNNELVILGYFTPQGSSGRMTQVSRWDVNGNHIETTVGWDGGYEYVYGGSYINGSIYLMGISLADRNMIAKVDLNGNGMCNNQTVNMSTLDLTASIASPNDQLTVSYMPTNITDLTWSILPYTYTRNVVCGSTVVGTSPESPSNWTVYPQPAAQDFYLEHPVMQNGQVSLLDLSGRLLWQSALDANATETRIPRGHWAAGMYVLRMQGDDGSVHAERVVLR